MIKQIQITDIERCVFVIRESFSTVAKEFNLTKENCPNHTSFMKAEKLQEHCDSGYLMYGYCLDENIVGYVSLSKQDNNAYELHNLAVLPEYRHFGYGKELLEFCKDKAKELGGDKILLDMIEENVRLKSWYAANGFVHTGIKKFENKPFITGFMELKI